MNIGNTMLFCVSFIRLEARTFLLGDRSYDTAVCQYLIHAHGGKALLGVTFRSIYRAFRVLFKENKISERFEGFTGNEKKRGRTHALVIE